jgi:hypothetical protein
MLRKDTLGLLSLLLILGCLLCRGGIVKNGSGKRKFAVVDGERFEIPEYYISAYQWQSERIQDSSLVALKEAGTFQKWREDNWKRLPNLNSSSDPDLRSAFTSKWRSGVEGFIEIADRRSSQSAAVWPSLINQLCPVFVIVFTDVNGILMHLLSFFTHNVPYISPMTPQVSVTRPSAFCMDCISRTCSKLH